MSVIDSILKPLLLIKAEKITECCSEFLKGKVLDVGAGRCHIAEKLQKEHNLKMSCLDVKDLSRTGAKVAVYDGKNMPFKDNEFDSALIAYVLHHCDDQIKVLKEAARVCRGNIVIFEDTKVSPITKFMDFAANKVRGVETPFYFHSEEEWKSVFKKLNLKITAVKHDVEREWFYPFVTHTMFVVRK